MARPSTKRFEYAKGVYYFIIKNGFNNEITINRKEKDKAIYAFKGYMHSHPGRTNWLGKWDGKKFIENSFEKEDA